MPKLPPSNPALQPHAMPSEPGITTDGSIANIPCRTLREAALVAEQLEQADILPVLSCEPSESATDSWLRVQVSAKALAAERELSESLNFRAEVDGAQQPLPLVMKMVALGLPMLLPLGCLIFLAEAGDFRNHGFARKLRDWKRWFLLGWVLWAAVVLLVMLLAGT